MIDRIKEAKNNNKKYEMLIEEFKKGSAIEEETEELQ